MKLKVHYIQNTKGENQAVKLDIDEWNQLKSLLNQSAQEIGETIDLIETPFKVNKLDIKPKKKRSFSDFLLEI